MAGADADQPEILEELRGMGVRKFVQWFSTPARSGFFFSAADILRLGEKIGVPVTPFNRTMAVDQFLRGAALDERLDLALSTLKAEMTAQLAAYRDQNLPAMDPWISRAEATLAAWSVIATEFFGDDDG